MREITLEELLEAGCHFGHQVTRQNPKARDFVYEARDNIHIIDLAKTKEGLDHAAAYVKSVAQKNGTMLIVGTKRQAKPIVLEEIKRAVAAFPSAEQNKGSDPASAIGLYYVTERWIGGTFTNLSEVTKNYKRLKDITLLLANEYERAKYTKKELGLFDKERQKLERFYGGTSDMKEIPNAIFVIDTHLENLAVKEGREMKAATVGIVDTNADPLLVDHPIPANDDAVGSIKLITSHIIDAWIEGRKEGEKSDKQQEISDKKLEETSGREKEIKEKPKKRAPKKAAKEEKKE